MKKNFLLSLCLLLSIVCVAQKQIEPATNLGSFIKSSTLKADSDTKSDTKDDKAVLSGWKAQKSLNDTYLVERLDSLVGISEYGNHISKEAWEYDDNFDVISYKTYENHWSGVFCVVSEQYAEYDDRGYIVVATVYVFWDPTTEQWDAASQRHRYVIDDRGYIVEEYIDLLNTSTNVFINSTWTVTTIDETDPENTLVTSIVKSWDGTNFFDDLKFEMAYDGHGNRIVYATYSWTGSAWFGEGVKYEDTYYYGTPQEDLIEIRIESTWNAGTSSWEVHNTREHVFNASGFPTLVTVKFVIGGVLTITQKEYIQYYDDVILVDDKVYSVSGGNETLAAQTLYDYQMIDGILYLNGGLSLVLGGVLTQLTEVEMKYSGHNMIYLKEGADGEIYTEQEIEYDSENRIIMQIDYGIIDWDLYIWGPASKLNFAYDGYGNVIEHISAFWEGDAFVNSSKSESVYNIDNIRTEHYTYYWANYNWIPNGGQLNKFDESVPASEVIMPLVFMGVEWSYKLLGMAVLAGDGQGGFYETDIYTAYYSEVEVQGIAETPIETVSAYIASNTLNIDSPATENVGIYNIAGTLMLSVKKPEGKANYDVSRLNSGVYIVRGASGWAKKVIK